MRDIMISLLQKNKVIIFSVIYCILFSGNITAKVSKRSRFENLELFNKILYLIESQYYRDVDNEKLINGAIRGMMNTLDPHSAFLDEKVFAKMQEDTSGEFGGLGIEVTQKDGVIVIITSIDDTPAYRSGLRPGDKIVEINHESILGATLEEAVKKMRGKPNTKINLGISREGVVGLKYFSVKREIIKVKPVKYELIDDNYIFIRLTQFQKRSASSIIDALKKLKKKAKKSGGAKGIVLDLRSNPGGLLEEAVLVTSIFLSEGVVVSTEGRNEQNKEIKYVKKTGYKELKLPMVVLINGSSASASEIVAGALKDHHRAIIMGTRSFGKGSVQTVAKVDDKNGVKLTMAQYMTPTGKKIQALGIIPDVELEQLDSDWIEEHKEEAVYLREEDLRNHLTATVETEEERNQRVKKEKEKRMERMNKAKNAEQKKKKEEKIYVKYKPSADYQVIQSVKHLKSLESFIESTKSKM